MKLHKGDKVKVRAGREAGQTGTVARVLPASEAVIVDGLNVYKRHTKPSDKNPKGGILDITKPFSAGKVALVCPHCNQPTRVGYQINQGHKERICRKCQKVLKS